MLPFVSVVIPCRNERLYIDRCLRSLLTNDYASDRFEVVVVDGVSHDGTRQVVERLAAQDPRVRLIDNPGGVTPVGMNRGVVASRGELILLAGAHNEYEADFVRRAVEYLERFPEADAVGGVIVTTPRTPGRVGRAVAVAISHPFGVGGSRFRTIPATAIWADTAFGCCYRRSVFQRIGLYNERLVRGQDLELNVRLRAAGGRILLAPGLRSRYYARSTLSEFLQHNVLNGAWAVLPFLCTSVCPVGVRHLVPVGFIVTLLLLTLGAAFNAGFRWPLVVLLGGYLIGLIGASLHAAWRAKDALLFPPLVVAFVALHFGYGLGGVLGAARAVGRWLQGERRPRGAEAWPTLADYRSRTAVT